MAKKLAMGRPLGGDLRRRNLRPGDESGRRPMIRTARCCEGFPVVSLKSCACWFILIPSLLPNRRLLMIFSTNLAQWRGYNSTSYVKQ